MYTQDKSHRITLRLNEEQFEFVRSQAEVLDVSPSEFLRMVINTTLVTTRAMNKKLEAVQQEFIAGKGGQGRANDEANSNDIV